MAEQIDNLVEKLRSQNYADVLQTSLGILEENKTDDHKLIELVARLKTDQNSPMAQHYLKESAGWAYQYPNKLLAERAFILLLQEDAIPAIRLYQAYGEKNFNGVDYSRLGSAHLINQDFAEGLRCYEKAIELEPNEPSHINNKAGALARLQRFDVALEAYEECLELDPQHPIALQAKKQLLIKLNQSDEVLEELKKELDEDPDSLEKLLAYFNGLVQFNQDIEAINLINKQLVPKEDIKVIPDDANPGDYKDERKQLNLCSALLELFNARHMWVKALGITNRMLSMFDSPPRYLEFAKIEYLTELDQFKDANQLLDDLEEKVEDSSRIKVARAEILCKEGKEKEALAIYNELSEDKSGTFYRHALHKKADINLTLGKIEDSHADLLELVDSNVMVAVQLINSKNYKPDDEVIRKLKAIARNPFTPEAQRENISFALALACDKRKEFKDAAEFLRQGNQLNRRKIKYNPNEFTQRCNNIIKHYLSAQGPQTANNLPENTPKPIFIVGMPRSGTTLTETIIGSHSLVAPCGELSNISRITRFIRKNYPDLKPYPACIDQLKSNMLAGMAQAYVNKLPEEGQGATYTADKLPHNFQNVGLIHRIFPKAPIIHVMRDPRDNGLSNFQQNFGAKFGGMGFAFDLEHLASEINNYWRLMKHWRKIGIPMIEFWYEDLVNEQELLSKALIDYCGLEWEEQILEFHKLERRVKTASVGQVRNKMYKTSAQKWRNYEELLQPMIDALDTSVVEFYEPDAA